MKILVTGFNPFDGEPINPSWEAVRRLPDTVERAEIIKVQIPTSFGRSADVVRAAILEHDSDVVVSVGQAGGQFAHQPGARRHQRR
jgi:pyroglutamyl-peptidase